MVFHSQPTIAAPSFVSFKIILLMYILGFPGGSDSRESACNAGDLKSIPDLGKSPGEGNGYPLQYSGLENYMDRGAWVGHDLVTFIFITDLQSCVNIYYTAKWFSYAHIYILLHILFLYYLSQGIGYSFPCSTVGLVYPFSV